MNLTDEFKSGFLCEPPNFIPEKLSVRLAFLSCLSRNKNSMTFLVFDEETKQKTVLKIALPGSPNNLQREHEILSRLDHPGIPKSIHFETDQADREYLLRDYAEGETLTSLLERDGVFSESHTLEIADSICEVLGYLHRQTPPLVYRDISPSNIVLTPNGKLSLIDFGIARESKKDQSFDTQYVGNIAFTSPENMGFAKTDPRSDIYTLGRLILYLATGDAELPHYEKRVTSPALRKVIEKCTRLSPEKRYRSVEHLKKRIGRILHPPTRNEILISVISATALVICGLIFWPFATNNHAEAPANEPLSATGIEAKDEVKIPVLIETRMNGKQYINCVVAVDNHHWYTPATDGKAELMVDGFGNYQIEAWSGNQAAITEAAVTRDSSELSFVFDFAEVPSAPEYLSLDFPFAARTEQVLDITNAETVTLSEQPNGISVAKVNDEFVMVIDTSVELSGHYSLTLESANEKGKAITTISLILSQENAITLISTPKDLDTVRQNLTGHYQLANDIDLSDFGAFEPIGNEQNPFSGIFDGAGHTISGLNIYGVSDHAGLFGQVTNGIIKNLILREPNIQTSHDLYKGTAALVGSLQRGLIDNCAVLGGSVQADAQFDSGVSAICGTNRGIITNCFNSAHIKTTNNRRATTDSLAGGIVGENTGFVADCGNIGDITGTSVAGGIAAFSDFGIITRCYNAGKVTAPTYAGHYPAGGIVQLLGRGLYISYCAFEKGSAQVGATVWSGGALIDILPLDEEDFLDFKKLDDAFQQDDSQQKWTYIQEAQGYPVPAGLFAK